MGQDGGQFLRPQLHPGLDRQLPVGLHSGLGHPTIHHSALGRPLEKRLQRRLLATHRGHHCTGKAFQNGALPYRPGFHCHRFPIQLFCSLVLLHRVPQHHQHWPAGQICLGDVQRVQQI